MGIDANVTQFMEQLNARQMERIKEARKLKSVNLQEKKETERKVKDLPAALPITLEEMYALARYLEAVPLSRFNNKSHDTLVKLLWKIKVRLGEVSVEV